MGQGQKQKEDNEHKLVLDDEWVCYGKKTSKKETRLDCLPDTGQPKRCATYLFQVEKSDDMHM